MPRQDMGGGASGLTNFKAGMSSSIAGCPVALGRVCQTPTRSGNGGETTSGCGAEKIGNADA
jgi:hypothetical protein